jgi:hypothetical protein
LREWSLHAALTSRRRAFSFEFLSADVVDRAPAPPPERGTVGFGMSIVGRATVSASGTVISNYAEYPAPPTSFNATPLVEALFQVYEAAVSEKRMAAAAGYFALTAVKTRVRDPSWPRESGLTRSKRVASALSVDAVVLNRLHELATEKGDISTARKVSDKAELDNPRPAHTAAELQWICEAIRVLALRLGQWEANAAGLPPLGMGDLPHV